MKTGNPWTGRSIRPAIWLAALVLVTGVGTGSVAVAEAEEEPPAADEMPDEETDDEGIEIDIRVGAQRQLSPVAVPDTIEAGGDTSEAARKVESILRDNIELLGYFDVLDEETFFFDTDDDGMSAVDIDFGNWFNVGATRLIKSSVRERDGAYELDLRLFNVGNAQRSDVDWSATTVDSRDELRPAINEFLNAVLEHITGERGLLGSRIAFAQRHGTDVKHIYTMSKDGSDRRRISQGEHIHLVPTFGPDRHVFFTNYLDGNPDLFVHRNGDLDRLSSSPGQNSGAAYCDGKLAVTMSRGTDNTDIYLVDPETGEVEDQLTDHWAIDVSPSWSPDCSRIAFVSGRSGGAHIFVMNADGSDQRRLTFQGSYNTEPDWSPRGDRIVFSARDDRSAFDIFTVDLDSNIERLTQDQGNNYEPVYSPNGRYVAFISTREDGRQLWMMTSDGRFQKRLTDEGSGYAEPAWTH